MTPDVNVLLAASRADHPHHPVARAWLQSAMAGAAEHADLGLLSAVLTSFLRLVTHPKVFAQPTPTAQALAFVDSLLSSPGVALLGEHDSWTHLHQLCLQHPLHGNDLPDAWIAACTLQNQQVLVTFDPGFAALLPAQNLLLLQATP